MTRQRARRFAVADLQVGPGASLEAAEVPVGPEGGHLDAVPEVIPRVQHPVLGLGSGLVQLHQVQPGPHVVVVVVWARKVGGL